jgi:predicted CopG family antitoxin
MRCLVHKKLTITLDERVYRGLYRTVGEGKISQFIEHLVEPYVLPENLEIAYKEMAMDEKREKEAKDWIEAVGDAGDAKR